MLTASHCGSKWTKTGVRCQEKLTHNSQQPRIGHSINRNTEKTNRQHVGKSLGAGGADFVGIKVDARDRCIDLQRHAGNAIVSMVTGGST